MNMISKEIKDKMIADISAELYLKGKISEEQFTEDLIEIYGSIPEEYKLENVKKRQCWL